jgi:hypothetical protein
MQPDKHPIISSHELKLKLAAQAEERPLVSVKSKLPSLDDAVQGFQDGELYAVSGPTKHGKTLLCQTLTRNFSEQHIYSLWFSYEVTPRGFINCFEDKLPLFYLPDGLVARSMEWVEKKILEGLDKFNTRVVFIDHLHFLFDLVAKQNMSLTIGSVVRRLKTLAVTHKLVIFLLCHTEKVKKDEICTYASIRDSSFVSQESDSVFIIERTGEVEGVLRVEFHRRTGCFGRKVNLLKVGKHFEEMEKDYD